MMASLQDKRYIRHIFALDLLAFEAASMTMSASRKSGRAGAADSRATAGVAPRGVELSSVDGPLKVAAISSIPAGNAFASHRSARIQPARRRLGDALAHLPRAGLHRSANFETHDCGALSEIRTLHALQYRRLVPRETRFVKRSVK